jgi:SAM-dependent methyltransferase
MIGTALVDDVAFDDRLPPSLQIKSSIHFTPIDVARHAATLLAPWPGMRVLDVGAGAGKFCLAAAHAVPTAHFVGVELREHLVRLATRLAVEWRIPNALFLPGDAFDLDWSLFDAFYFYNPFAEYLLDKPFLLDDELDFARGGFDLNVAAVQERLTAARPGTRVVTFHGFGGAPPAGYQLVLGEEIETGRMELWIKSQVSR